MYWMIKCPPPVSCVTIHPWLVLRAVVADLKGGDLLFLNSWSATGMVNFFLNFCSDISVVHTYVQKVTI